MRTYEFNIIESRGASQVSISIIRKYIEAVYPIDEMEGINEFLVYIEGGTDVRRIMKIAGATRYADMKPIREITYKQLYDWIAKQERNTNKVSLGCIMLIQYKEVRATSWGSTGSNDPSADDFDPFFTEGNAYYQAQQDSFREQFQQAKERASQQNSQWRDSTGEKHKRKYANSWEDLKEQQRQEQEQRERQERSKHASDFFEEIFSKFKDTNYQFYTGNRNSGKTHFYEQQYGRQQRATSNEPYKELTEVEAKELIVKFKDKKYTIKEFEIRMTKEFMNSKDVSKTYRGLAKMFHPDTGGNNELMCEVTKTYKLYKKK